MLSVWAMATTPSDWYRSLPPAQLSRLASTFMDLTFAEGLTVTAQDTAERRAIPSCLTPVLVSTADLDRRVRIAELLTSAIAKIATAMISGPDRGVLLDPLSPFEQRAVEATYESVDIVATTRYDAYVAKGVLRPLELNATIPAMQGYSDIAAEALIRTVASARGIPRYKAQGLIARNGSNTAALLRALVACYRARGGKAAYPLIALAVRPNDAQLTELTYIARTFTSLGYPTHVTIASTVRPTADGRWATEAGTVDLIYRHIFARRIDEAWPIAAGLLQPSPRHHIYNQVLAQLEEKAVLAELSRAGAEASLASRYRLTADEAVVGRDHVPWTRRALDGRATGPGGDPVNDLRDLVRSAPARFVLKPNWDYGGKAVFVGAAFDDASIQERVRGAFGRAMKWTELVDTIFGNTGGAYIVQEFVEIDRQPMLICEPSGPAWRDVYVDFSAYASLGIEPPGWGGVCRFSSGRIVNILGGGGVAPLLREDVAADLFS